MFSEAKSRQLAQLMCTVTDELLYQAWVRDNPRKRQQLNCRVGRGKATYHCQRGGDHLITYGVKMVADKSVAERAQAWTSAREITQRGYFHGELSLLNLLAHTVCHEFAHFVQGVAGARRRGSIHNRVFYQLLDELYGRGQAEQVRMALDGACVKAGLSIAFCEESQRVSSHLPLTAGQEIRLRLQGQAVKGKVLRVNPRSYSIKPLDEKLQHIRYYRIPRASVADYLI